jgi:hypothetical protein
VEIFVPLLKLSLHEIVLWGCRAQRKILVKLKESNGVRQVIFQLKRSIFPFTGVGPMTASIKEGL